MSPRSGREPWPVELAPYAHQFKGDMMKEPVLLRVATGPSASHLYLAVNRRPGAPCRRRRRSSWPSCSAARASRSSRSIPAFSA